MRISRLWAGLFVLTAAAAPAGSRSVTDPQQAASAAVEKAPPLVRMDLLAAGPSETVPPGRNIFSPQPVQPVRTASVIPGMPATPGLPPAGPAGAVVPEAQSEPTAPPVASVDLRFIGYVDSPRTRKIIGLLIFQGQARAVVEGEVISEGVRVVKIGRDEIEVALPDGSTRTFSLEGEE